MSERSATFRCFGSDCTVVVTDAGARDRAAAAVALASARLLEWHARFSRFEPASELSRLNADPRSIVPISALMGRVLAAALAAAERTEGLVDATLLDEIERAGYDVDLTKPPVHLSTALPLAPRRSPATPNSSARWRGVDLDRRAGTVTRAPGVRFDSGGIAKGVFADELGALLADHDAFAVDCAGDILLGGTAHVLREVHVQSPFDSAVLHTFELRRGAIATSGIGKRSWIDDRGAPAHHLLDPSTGRPAFTGIVQVTALAPTATQAEVASKAALLSGPEGAQRWLPHGGLVVLDDGSQLVTKPRPGPERQASDSARRAPRPARAR
jgi:thiamine biosynthesis lipoprotein